MDSEPGAWHSPASTQLWAKLLDPLDMESEMQRLERDLHNLHEDLEENHYSVPNNHLKEVLKHVHESAINHAHAAHESDTAHQRDVE